MIADSTAAVGLYTSIGIDSTDKVYISYYDGTNRTLKYATNINLSGEGDVEPQPESDPDNGGGDGGGGGGGGGGGCFLATISQ